MREPVGLDEIAPGECAVVLDLQNEATMRRRLRDLGLTEGGLVECLGRSPLGDPAAYLIRGAVIAIRKIDAKQIRVFRLKRRGSTWD